MCRKIEHKSIFVEKNDKYEVCLSGYHFSASYEASEILLAKQTLLSSTSETFSYKLLWLQSTLSRSERGSNGRKRGEGGQNITIIGLRASTSLCLISLFSGC